MTLTDALDRQSACGRCRHPRGLHQDGGPCHAISRGGDECRCFRFFSSVLGDFEIHKLRTDVDDLMQDRIGARALFARGFWGRLTWILIGR